MNCITADLIYSPGSLLSEHCLEVQEDGTIISLRPIAENEKRLIRYEGVILPGFVNAHCHLELSAFRGKLKEGLGMTAFAQAIVQERQNISDDAHQLALYDSLREAFYTGTVAIGDICNTALTADSQKDFPQLFIHSFVELIGLDASKADEILEKGKALQKALGENSSLALHAPYSVSASLRDKVYEEEKALLSVHLLESVAERLLFEEGRGDFLDFYEKIKLPQPVFEHAFSHDHLLENLPKDRPILFVHCLEATEEEINALASRFPLAYFCICPKSNQFIHSKVPDITRFQALTDRICLGTDSLASNSSLRMLEELQLLQQHYPELPLHTLIKWASTQGAEALQLSAEFGAFIPGKKPGVNLLEGIDLESLALSAEVKFMKIY